MAQKNVIVIADLFINFRTLCKSISNESSYKMKTSVIKNFIQKGKYDKPNSSPVSADVPVVPGKNDLHLLAKLLLPATQKRVYNVKDKQILKFFSQIFRTDLKKMTEHLENQGIVSDTVEEYFNKSKSIKPLDTSVITMQEVDESLEALSKETKEDNQTMILTNICKKCTAEDLRYIVRLIKHDLRTNCGPKHFLDALDENAYEAWRASSNLKQVIEKWQKNRSAEKIPGLTKQLSIKSTLMTPVKPMLAEACKSMETAFKKCPNGILAEIKYDGERVQIHKEGVNFQYFSRSLKPVQPHKISEIKDYIARACPKGDNLILDGEVLLMDSTTKKPLPFGTLGIHKKAKFKDATVCYVIFDILQFNDDDLMKRPMKERREILQDNIEEIPGRIIHSELKEIKNKNELRVMLKTCFDENLEGLVLKDIMSKYEPGKRHWLKIKKDYLEEGSMADTADLVVLGAYIGTGNKGGLMSVFLMGCYDETRKIWVTVTKCGNGHDDNTLKKLQKQLAMTKISKDFSKVPLWLDVDRGLTPDFVITDPKKSQVWEITGAEFSNSSVHTADGISIRFPRVTRIRDDKNWKSATSLKQLKVLFEESKKTSDIATSTSSNAPQISSQTFNKKRKSESKLEEEYDVPQEKKIKIDESKKPCPYGGKCYRKSQEHLKEYRHDEKKTPSSDTINLEKPKKELRNIFTGAVFGFNDKVENLKKIKRYIIAYDGSTVDDVTTEEITHVITDTYMNEFVKRIKQVKPDWIWACVKAKDLVPLDKRYLLGKP